MKKEIIIAQLQANHEQFIQSVLDLSSADYLRQPGGKWSAGQHLDHILRAVKPVNLALSLPPFLLKLMFGKANRASRDFESLVEKYQSRLAAGGRASGRFIPPEAVLDRREPLAKSLRRQIEIMTLKHV